jgi:hypothetical protein
MKNILEIPMQENDAEAATIGDYFRSLLKEIWTEGEGFSGKRPFGNSGWECDLYVALVKAGVVDGKLDSEGYLEKCDEAKANTVIMKAITSFGLTK